MWWPKKKVEPQSRKSELPPRKPGESDLSYLSRIIQDQPPSDQGHRCPVCGEVIPRKGVSQQWWKASIQQHYEGHGLDVTRHGSQMECNVCHRKWSGYGPALLHLNCTRKPVKHGEPPLEFTEEEPAMPEPLVMDSTTVDLVETMHALLKDNKRLDSLNQSLAKRNGQMERLVEGLKKHIKELEDQVADVRGRLATQVGQRSEVDDVLAEVKQRLRDNELPQK